MFHKFICELLCQMRDSSPSFFHKDTAKKEENVVLERLHVQVEEAALMLCCVFTSFTTQIE